MKTNEQIIEEAKQIFIGENERRWNEVFPRLEKFMTGNFPDAVFTENKFGYSFWNLAGFDLRINTKCHGYSQDNHYFTFDVWIKKGNDKEYPYSKIENMFDFGKYVLGNQLTKMYLA